jgi:hypothetical protein
VHGTVLYAYRWKYILSGVQDPRFTGILGSMIMTQAKRVTRALLPIVNPFTGS